MKLQLLAVVLLAIVPCSTVQGGSMASYNQRERGNGSITQQTQFLGFSDLEAPDFLRCSVVYTYIDNNNNNTNTTDNNDMSMSFHLHLRDLGTPANATYSCSFLHNTPSTKTLIDCTGQLVAAAAASSSSYPTSPSSSDGLHDPPTPTYSFIGNNSCSFNAITTTSSSSTQLLHLHYHTTSQCINVTTQYSSATDIITAAPSASTFSCSVFTTVRSSDGPLLHASPPLFTSNDTTLCTRTGTDVLATSYDLGLCFLNTSTTLQQYPKDAFANGVMFPFMF